MDNMTTSGYWQAPPPPQDPNVVKAKMLAECFTTLCKELPRAELELTFDDTCEYITVKPADPPFCTVSKENSRN